MLLDIGKHADFALSSYEIRLASSGGNYGSYTLLIVDGVRGTVKLAGVEIASLTADSPVQLRITVDFAAASVTAYGADLEKIAVVPLGDVPKAKAGYTQPATWLEWQRLATNYLFYGYQTRGQHPSGTQTALTLDNLMIVDGRYYEALKSKKDS